MTKEYKLLKDWTREPGDKDFEQQFRAAVVAIRAIADGATS